MAKSFNELRQKMSPERRARNAAEAQRTLLEEEPVEGAERKLREHFGAQVSKSVDADALRELAPGLLAAFTIGTAGGLGVRFAWDLLGAILLRATDEELAALFRPTRGGR